MKQTNKETFTLESLSAKLNKAYSPTCFQNLSGTKYNKSVLYAADLATYELLFSCVTPGNSKPKSLAKKVLVERMNGYKDMLRAALRYPTWDAKGAADVKARLQNTLTLADKVDINSAIDYQSTFNVYQYARLFWWAFCKGTLENQQAVLVSLGYDKEAELIAQVVAENKAASDKKKAEANKKKAEKAAAAPKTESKSKSKTKTEKVEAGWTCPNCGHEGLLADFPFCPFCQHEKPAPVATEWTCSNGHKNPMDFPFCPYCREKKPEVKVEKKVAAPKAEAPKAEAPKAETKTTRSSKSKKVEAVPAAPAEAPVVVDTSNIGKTMNAVDLEEEKQPDLIDLKYQQFRETASPEQTALFDEYLNLFIEREFTENANRVNAQATPSADTLARKSH